MHPARIGAIVSPIMHSARATSENACARARAREIVILRILLAPNRPDEISLSRRIANLNEMENLDLASFLDVVPRGLRKERNSSNISTTRRKIDFAAN